MGSIYFEARIDSDQLKKDIQQINETLSQMAGNAEAAGNRMDNMFRGLAASVAAYFSFDFASQFITSIARIRGEFQQLEVAFETMLDSKDKADKLMAQVVEFAAKTPFELKDVASGAKSLMAFGVTSEEIIPTLKALGDVSAGLSVPIERLILNFGQVKTQAQLTGRELRDFNIAGVPIVAELAKNLNRTEQEIQEMVTAGKIGFKEVSDAFRSMTDEGGRFANLMDKQSQTITGLQSNLRDAWNQMLNDIGKNSEGAIAGTIRAGISLVENYEKVIDVLKILVATYGTYKAAVIAANVAMQTGNYPYIIMQIRAITTAVNAATLSWKAMETAQKATVVGLVAAGVTALISALSLLNKKTDEAAEFNTQLNNTYASEVTSLNSVFDALKKTNQQTSERKDTLKIINDRYGEYIGNLLTEKSTLQDIERAQKNATDAMIARITVMSSEGELQKQLGDISDKWNSRFGKFTEVYSQTFGADRLPEFITAINEGIEQEIKSGGGIVKRGTLEYSKIAEDIYLQFISDISKKSGALQYTWDEFKTAFLDFAEYKAKKGGTLEYLQSLIEANKKLTTVTTADDAQATIKKQIETTTKALSDARTKLDQMRESTSKATIDQITSQEQTVKDLETRLTALTGFSKKEADKQIKVEEEKNKALTELADREIELRNQTEAAKIAIMQDGADKQIKEAELSYKMELQAIEKYAADLLKTYNDAQLTKKLPTVSVLPQEYQADIDTQTKLAAQKYADEKVKIENDSARKIAAVWQDVSNELLSEKDKELADINRYYAERIKLAEDAKDNELKMALEASKAIAERKVETNYYIEKIDKEQEVALKTIDLQKDIYLSDVDYEKKKFETSVKYIQKKIDYLTKQGADINAEEIKKYIEQLKDLGESFDTKNIDNVKRALVLQRNEIQKTISEYKKLGKSDEEIAKLTKGLEEVNKAIFSINTAKLQELGQVFSSFGDAVGQIDDSLSSFGGIVSGIGQLFTGDARGILTIFTSLKDISEETARKQKEIEQEQLTALNDSLEKMNVIFENLYNSIDRAFGTEKIARYNSAIQLLGYNLNSVIGSINNITADTDLDRIMKDIIGSTTAETGSGTRIRYLMSYSLQGLEDAIKKNEQLYQDLLIKYSESGTEEIKTLLNEYASYVDKLYSLKDEYMQLVTATTSAQIADSIIGGFEEGKQSMADFADDFEQLMNQALIAALKTNVLDVPIQKFYADFAAAMEDNALSAEERRALKDVYAQIIDSASQWAEGIKELTGKDPFESAIDNKGLTGSIKSITEDTAGLIAGQFMAMRTDLLGIHTDTSALKTYAAEMSNLALDQMAVVNQSVTYLAGIEKNTRDIALLRETNQKLTEMNTYLKNL